MTISVTYLGLADAAKPTDIDACWSCNSWFNDMWAMDENTLYIRLKQAEL